MIVIFVPIGLLLGVALAVIDPLLVAIVVILIVGVKLCIFASRAGRRSQERRP